MSDSLWSHGLQHVRFSCPSLSPGVCSNSGPLSQWCYLTISSSITPFSSCLPIFPSTRLLSSELSLCIWWLKYWNFSISPSNDYSGLISFRMDWLGLLAVQETLKSLLYHHNLKASILWYSAFFFYGPTLTSIHDYWKNHSFDYTDLCQQSDVSVFQTTVICMKWEIHNKK